MVVAAQNHRIKKSFSFFRDIIWREFILSHSEEYELTDTVIENGINEYQISEAQLGRNIRFINRFLRIYIFRCYVTKVLAGTEVTAIQVFMTLNTRGKDLTQSDLIKSSFYKRFVDLDIHRFDEFGHYGTHFLIRLNLQNCRLICSDYFVVKTGTHVTKVYTRFTSRFIQDQSIDQMLITLRT